MTGPMAEMMGQALPAMVFVPFVTAEHWKISEVVKESTRRGPGWSVEVLSTELSGK